MEAKKPFIFVHPLSPTLQTLLEQTKEKAEEDNIEVYEIEEITEANQLLPSLGTSLTIMSSPKKCAKILQQNKKIIKKSNLKIVLLSPKQLPWKIQEKFQKIGLTECIPEPVPQRTLSYKVNLLLRSIKIQKETEEEDNKTLKAQREEEQKGFNQKSGDATTNQEHAESRLANEQQKKGNRFWEAEGKFDKENGKMRGDEHQEEQSGHLRGKNSGSPTAGGHLEGESSSDSKHKGHLEGGVKENRAGDKNWKGDLEEEKKKSTDPRSELASLREELQNELKGDVDGSSNGMGNLQGELDELESKAAPESEEGKNRE